MTARELLKQKIPDDEKIEGKVEIPFEFEKIYMLAGVSADEALDGVITKISEDHKVIPQYRTLKEKIGGALFGFYINHSVDQQNNFNENMAKVLEEFDELSKEKKRLMEEINTLQVKLLRPGK